MTDFDASLPLRKAILDKLKGTSAVSSLLEGDKVYTAVPASAAKDYVSFGPIQVLPDRAAEYLGADIRIQLDVWAKGPEQTGAMRIGRAIQTTLEEASLTLIDGQRLVNIETEQARYFIDSDGITVHGALIFSARTEPTA